MCIRDRFGVVISQLALKGEATDKGVNVVPVAIWLVGIAAFHLCPLMWPVVGSALPALVITLLLGSIYRIARRPALQSA